LRTVEANANGKPFCRQKATPLLVKKRSICLNAIHDAPVGRTVLALKGHDLVKIVQPQQARFPTVPGKADGWIGASINVLDNVLFQDVVWHPKRFALWIQVHLFQIVTVVTVQIADRANWFGKDLKLPRSSGHIGIFFFVTLPNLTAAPVSIPIRKDASRGILLSTSDR
jgi:hypothetical protein